MSATFALPQLCERESGSEDGVRERLAPRGKSNKSTNVNVAPIEVAFLGIYEEMWWSADLAVAGDCAVIGTGPMLYAIDVSVPANPILVGKHGIPGSVSNLATYDDLLHVSEYGRDTKTTISRVARASQGRPARLKVGGSPNLPSRCLPRSECAVDGCLVDECHVRTSAIV